MAGGQKSLNLDTGEVTSGHPSGTSAPGKSVGTLGTFYNPNAKPVAPIQPAHHGGGGGFMGSVLGAVRTIKNTINSADSYVSGQAIKFGQTAYGIGTGLYNMGANEGQTLVNDFEGKNSSLNKAEWNDLLHGHIGRMFQEGAKFKGANSPEAGVSNAVQGMTVGQIKNVEQIYHHPFENLTNDVLTALPLAGGAAGVAGRVADATAVAREGASLGQIGRVAIRGTEPGVRTLNVPRLAGPSSAQELIDNGESAAYAANAEGNAPPAERALSIKFAKKAAPAQGPANLANRVVQLNSGRSYLSRYGAAVHDAVVQRSLDKIPAKGRATPIATYALARGAKSLDETANTTADVRETRVYNLEHATVEKSLTSEESSLAGVLQHGNVLPEEMAAKWRENAAQDRISIPQADGPPVEKILSPDDRARMLQAANVADSLAAKNVLHLQNGSVEANADLYPRLAARAGLQQTASDIREGALRSTARMTDEEMQARKNLTARVAGVDRQGKAFVSLKPTDNYAPTSRFARSPKKSVSQSKNIPIGEEATGAGLALGHIPADSNKEMAQSLKSALRVANTNDLRGATSEFGSDVRMTKDDWLVAKSLPSIAEKLPDEAKILLGKLRDTMTPKEHQKFAEKWGTFVKENILNRESELALGERAPEGWTWVHKSLIPSSLKTNEMSRGAIEKQLAKLSTAVTGATVFFKPGHIPQRFTTNLAFNAIHGSADPVEWFKSDRVLRQLSKPDRRRLAAATGTHGYQSLPMEGQGAIARITRTGANAYAKYVDAHFRQNAALYELRKIGYDTPEKVSRALDAIETGGGLPGHELMRINAAMRRAKRGAGDYDTNALEKRTIQRALWFYGWTKAATRFAGHTATEHPGKFGLIGSIGNQGNAEAEKVLGKRATYELGVTPTGGGGAFPWTFNPSNLLPTGTVGQVATAAAHPLSTQNGIQSFLQPAYSGLAAVAEGKGLGGFASQVFQPTPELQGITAALHPQKTGGSDFFPTSSSRLFGSTWQSMLLRSVAGAGLTPRRYNKAQGQKDAARQFVKPRIIKVYP